MKIDFSSTIGKQVAAIYESRMFRETASRHIPCPLFLLSMLQQRRVVGLKADVHKACAAFSDGEFNRIRKRTMKEKKSSVLRARRLSGKVLTFLLGAEDDALREFADDSKTGRAGKTLVKEDSLRITFVALKKGTVLPSHRVAGPVSIQTIRGCLRLSTDTEDRDVTAGTLIALGPGVAHTAKAHTDCAILLTFAMSHN
jgi:quercetin dioxygenase-like cupin family protein